jgi:hypothetical protein
MREREKRTAARMRRPISVQYTVQGVFGWRVGRLSDFGWDGARLLGSELLDTGMAVQLRLVMPGTEGLDVLDATVVWARTLRGTPAKHEHGLAFTSPASKVQQTINAALRYVLQSANPESSAAERRRSTRTRKTREVSYREVDRQSVGWRPANIVNLSVHGMQFKSSELLKSGETIEMRLPSADTDEAIVLRGRVVWSQIAPQESARYGVEFTAPAPGQADRFEAFVRWVNAA